MISIQTRISGASAYEQFARRSPSGFAIPLPKEPRPFWSKGWRGCEFNCGGATDDWSAPMVERIARKDGTITRGFYCR